MKKLLSKNLSTNYSSQSALKSLPIPHNLQRSRFPSAAECEGNFYHSLANPNSSHPQMKHKAEKSKQPLFPYTSIPPPSSAPTHSTQTNHSSINSQTRNNPTTTTPTANSVATDTSKITVNSAAVDGAGDGRRESKGRRSRSGGEPPLAARCRPSGRGGLGFCVERINEGFKEHILELE
ncbi:serum response factor-binding protein 1, partial [Striga asiatica]